MLLVARDHETAFRSANLVRVEFEKATPIVTIEEAIEQKSFLTECPLKLHNKMSATEEHQNSIDEAKETKFQERWGQYTHFVKGFLLNITNCTNYMIYKYFQIDSMD